MVRHPSNRFVAECSNTGKRSFPNKKAAKAAARAMPKGLHAFRCLFCGHWHIGHSGNLTREEHRQAAQRKAQ